MPCQRRRAVLQTSASALITGVAGCIGVRPGSPTQSPSDTQDSREHSGSWPQLAHDQRNTSYNPGTTGPVESVEIDWTASPTDSQLFEPVVTDSVFLTDNFGDGTAIALDPNSGTVRWENRSLPPIRWPPAVIEDRVMVVTRTSENHVRLHALATDDGAASWTTTITASSGRYPPVAPTVTPTQVFVASSTGVIALDVASGEQAWTQELSEHPVQTDGGVRATEWATPAVDDELVYTVDRNEKVGTDRHVHALDRETGAREWTTTLSVPESYWRFDSHVLIGDQDVLVTISGSKGDGGAGNTSDGASVAAGGRLVVMAPASGRVRWTHEFGGTVRMPALRDGVVFVPVHDPAAATDTVHAISVAEEDAVWTQTIDGVSTGVSVTDEALYVNGDGLAAVDVADGSRVWQVFAGRNVGAPIVADDTVYATVAPEGGFRQTELAAVRE